MAREKVEKAVTLLPKGWIKNILGDARRLSELLSQADVIITSPPYSDSAIQDYGTSNKALLEFEKQVRESFRKFGYFEYNGRRYTEEEWRRINKGELKPRGMPELWAEIIRRRKGTRYNDDNPENIGNLPLGNIDVIDVIITSPPYADAKKGGEADVDAMVERWDRAFRETGEKWNSWGKTWATPGRARSLQALGSGYSNSPDNIGNLPFGKIPDDGQAEELASKLMRDGKPTYLSEMLKVYREMWRVLKPGGRAIIIVKPFIRNKEVIDLPHYTYLLMRLCGFELEKLYKLRLKYQSFWRVLFYRKHPEVPRIAHEYVLVCRKNLG
jgi:DNA modification methylase